MDAFLLATIIFVSVLAGEALVILGFLSIFLIPSLFTVQKNNKELKIILTDIGGDCSNN